MSAQWLSPAFSPTLRVVSDRSPDTVHIRGVRLQLGQLVGRSYFTLESIAQLRSRLHAAAPFPHLVIKDLFNPALLELVQEEFDLRPEGGWKDVRSVYESTRRSELGAALGPASQLYFNVVNSSWFTQWLSDITGTPYLLTDPQHFGGGLHESRPGGNFAIHRDFSFHPHVGLKNEMVMITYLNRGWQDAWGGVLELWNAKNGQCKARVSPEFGHTLLMPHGPASYHGHPGPLCPPEGVTRRSVACYYYTSPKAGQQDPDEAVSVFMKTRKTDRVKKAARLLTPPLVWKAMKRLTRKTRPLAR
ncbi:2OG-Fe(II) oxygenase (plasmid) [Comamonadaceae bacterium OTU4NAUVB1]|nr:2OG-Fe(II) oxygenase [Comamonadaceae bacterium OTU4NAUVB1]